MKLIADINEHEINFNDIIFKYMLKEPSLDTQKLIVVFKSFDKNNCLKKYFEKRTISDIKSTVLLLKDEFNGMPLVCTEIINNSISDIVFSFIKLVALEYFVPLENIIVVGDYIAGMSAICFGLKYKVNHIISIFPINDVETYLAYDKNNLYNIHYTSDNVLQLNDKIKISLSECADKNIYIFLKSLNEVVKFKERLADKNVFYIDSSRFHTKKPNGINENILNVLESIIKLIEIGLRIEISNEQENCTNDIYLPFKILEKQQIRGKFFRTIKKFEINNDKCYIHGTAFLQGYERSMPDLLERQIIFKSSSNEYKYNVQILECEDNINKYYSGTYCNYLYSDYFSQNPLDLRRIDYGTYSVWINIVSKKCLQVGYKGSPLTFFSDHAFYILFSDNNHAKMKKSRLVSNNGPTVCNIISKTFNKLIYKCEGQFIVKGVETESQRFISFYLIFHGRRDYCIKIRNKNSNELNYVLGDFGKYNNSYFSTDEAVGVDVSNFEKGSYAVFISFICNIYIFSHQIDYIVI